MLEVFRFNTESTLVNPYLAKMIGLKETLIIQKINELLKINRDINKNMIEGSIWAEISINDFHDKFFPYMSKSTIKRSISHLKDLNLIKIKKFNNGTLENSNWYTINYDVIEHLLQCRHTKSSSSIRQFNSKIQNEPLAKLNAEPSRKVQDELTGAYYSDLLDSLDVDSVVQSGLLNKSDEEFNEKGQNELEGKSYSKLLDELDLDLSTLHSYDKS